MERRREKDERRNDGPARDRAPASLADSPTASSDAKVAELRRELAETRERERATNEILGVISRSLTDTQPVFEAIVQAGVRLFPEAAIAIALPDGDVVKAVAIAETDPARADAWFARFPFPLTREYMHSFAILENLTIDLPDVREAPPELEKGAQNFLSSPYKAVTIIPLVRGETPIGALSIVRIEPGPLTAGQHEILKTFADQAVIAIENVRLFEEVQARTHELSEALRQRTATGEVLNVISRSPSELQPVIDAIVTVSARLCRADLALIFLLEDGAYRLVAANEVDDDSVRVLAERTHVPSRKTLVGRVALDGKIARVDDIEFDTEYDWAEARTVLGLRSAVTLPLNRDGETVGMISLVRKRVEPFTDKEIELVSAFADQAVIAIQNVRLFEQVQERTRELSEALQLQTATADVLKVISRSAFELETVLHTLVESAGKLCDADKGTITRQIGEQFFRRESFGHSPEFMEYVSAIPIHPDRASISGRALYERKVVHIDDVTTDPEYSLGRALELDQFRTGLGVPMFREGKPIGVLALTRVDVRPFTEREIEVVSTFADQAAIAIENSRLFESVQARTRELSQSLADLRAAQDRLVQSEKLASLGQLTAGIAHEIKNPLNFINNFASLSTDLLEELGDHLDELSLDARVREVVDDLMELLRGNVEKIVQHGQRADSIVKNMLLHSRAGTGDYRLSDVNALVEEAINLAYHGERAATPGFNVAIVRTLDPAAGSAEVYPQEITRVLLNLIGNGFHATKKRKEMGPDPYEPTLTVSTRNRDDAVEIHIRDNGTGIPETVRDKIFNPFFTTKPAGEGTGLGLSLSHDIVVKQHGGTISVETETGAFTEFRIRLPRSMNGTAEKASAG